MSERELLWHPDWTKDAECAKMPLDFIDENFFNYGKNARKIQRAKDVCNRCPVIMKCFQANKLVPLGILFGMTWLERWRHPLIYNQQGFPDSKSEFSFFAQGFQKSLHSMIMNRLAMSNGNGSLEK